MVSFIIILVYSCNTEFTVKNINVDTNNVFFIRAGVLNELRREAIELLQTIRKNNLKREKSKSGYMKRYRYLSFKVESNDFILCLCFLFMNNLLLVLFM